jgi:N-acetylglucosaminylphosphatidylinositol deacetylase
MGSAWNTPCAFQSSSRHHSGSLWLTLPQLVTFDSTGITQHPNHIALSEVYRHLPTGTRPRLLELHSPSVVTKFTGPLWTLVLAARDALHTGAMRSLVLSTFSPRSSATASPAPSAPALGAAPQAPELKFVASPAQYGTTLHAMRAHASQLVWFRWLYVSFSHLMWVNQIRDATPVAPAV